MPDGKPLGLSLSFSDDQARVVEVLKRQPDAVGVPVTLQGSDFGSFGTAMSQGKYQLALIGQGGLSADPDLKFDRARRHRWRPAQRLQQGRVRSGIA